MQLHETAHLIGKACHAHGAAVGGQKDTQTYNMPKSCLRPPAAHESSAGAASCAAAAAAGACAVAAAVAAAADANYQAPDEASSSIHASWPAGPHYPTATSDAIMRVVVVDTGLSKVSLSKLTSDASNSPRPNTTDRGEGLSNTAFPCKSVPFVLKGCWAAPREGCEYRYSDRRAV